jgi:hypothetical protein
MASRAPSIKKRCTIAFPIPLPPPVTMATLFANLILDNYGSRMASVLLTEGGTTQRSEGAACGSREVPLIIYAITL